MKKNLLWLAGAAFAALAFTSCYYDPYYGGGSSVTTTYSTGYGDGYGYGGSSFNTSVFVSTGDPRWGYDPYCYSYYDYRSRRYYDPYLYGYYPVGYRPPVVYGVPHPHGWRPGHGYMRPPSRINNVTVVNYRNRESAYRGSRYGWARQVRQQPQSSSRPPVSRPGGSNQGYHRNESSRPSTSWSRDNQRRESSRPAVRQQDSRQQNARPSSRYNTPISIPQQAQRPGRQNAGNPQRQQAQRQQAQRQQAQRQAGQQRQQAQRQAQRGGGGGGERRGENEGRGRRGDR